MGSWVEGRGDVGILSKGAGRAGEARGGVLVEGAIDPGVEAGLRSKGAPRNFAMGCGELPGIPAVCCCGGVL